MDLLSEFSNATVLLTGASGFLGSFLLDVLAGWNEANSTQARILAVDNNLVGLPERVAHLQGRPDIAFFSHGISDPFEPGEPVNYILHCAGVASPTFYRQYPLETIEVNVNGTRNLLELCRVHPVKAMLHLSTSEIYGDPPPEAIPTSEDYRGFVSCTGPRACYDESKRLAETMCVIYKQKYGVPVKVGRPFNVYGPGQRIDDRRIIPDLMSAVINNEPMVLLSDGRATRSFCYVRDAAWAMLLILIKGHAGEAYNLGNDREEVSVLQVAQVLKEVSGTSKPIEHRVSPDPQYLVDNPQRRCPDLRKLKALGDFEPQILLREGLTRTLRSYREE
jgi:dTDP-glucose 4,6-dehydratase/UDP-glucuronate decarboxylase